MRREEEAQTRVLDEDGGAGSKPGFFHEKGGGRQLTLPAEAVHWRPGVRFSSTRITRTRKKAGGGTSVNLSALYFKWAFNRS